MLTLTQATAASSIGVAAGSSGQVCLAMPAPSIARGTAVTIVDPNAARLHRATVGERIPSCEALAKANVPGPYYRLQLTLDAESDPLLGVAFIGALQSTKSSSGAVTLRLNAEHPRVHVRSCTSSEGAHLTVWAGVPLKSRLLWHQYYYLGYDVEPSCEDAEVRAPAV